jgi:hypothetical protein
VATVKGAQNVLNAIREDLVNLTETNGETVVFLGKFLSPLTGRTITFTAEDIAGKIGESMIVPGVTVFDQVGTAGVITAVTAGTYTAETTGFSTTMPVYRVYSDFVLQPDDITPLNTITVPREYMTAMYPFGGDALDKYPNGYVYFECESPPATPSIGVITGVTDTTASVMFIFAQTGPFSFGSTTSSYAFHQAGDVFDVQTSTIGNFLGVAVPYENAGLVFGDGGSGIGICANDYSSESTSVELLTVDRAYDDSAYTYTDIMLPQPN